VSNNAALLAWIRNQILVSRSGGYVIRLDLAHLPVGGMVGHEIQSFDVPGDKPLDTWFEETTDQITTAAQIDSGALGGVQRYVVRSYRRDLPDKCSARTILRIRAVSDGSEDSGFESEPATPKGLLSQLMRHNEANTRALVQSLQVVMVTMQRTLSRLSEQNDKLQTQRIETMESMEEMLSAKLDRELSAKREENRQGIMTDLVKEVKLLAPAVIQKMTGVQTEGAASLKDIALKRFFESLTDDQKTVFIKGLNTDQQIALAEIMQTMQGSN
jgi:hypothetical protein